MTGSAAVRRRQASHAAGLPLLLLALAACGGAPARPRTVLLMTLDSVRRDHVSAYGYRPRFHPGESTTPTFDALAAAGVLFEKAYASTSWTLPSHATLLTGLPDQVHGVTDNSRRIPPSAETLAEAFEAAGWRTQGFFSGPNLSPEFGFGDGFERYTDCSGLESALATPESGAEAGPSLAEAHVASHETRTSPMVSAALLEALAERSQSSASWFLFAHWWDPHYYYQAPLEWTRRFADPNYRGPVDGRHQASKGVSLNSRDVQQLKALYDAEIAYTDHHLAGIVGQLELSGQLQDTLIALTSDHGEEFYEHGRWGHQRTLYEEVLQVPLCLSWPRGLPWGVRIAEPVGLIDVYHTLLGACGIDSDPRVESRDLAPLWSGGSVEQGPLYFHLDATYRQIQLDGLLSGRQKLILDPKNQRVERYDLGSNPWETRPPGLEGALGDFAGDPLLARLDTERARRRARFESLGFSSEGSGAEMDAALRAALEAAGYLKGD